jgi:prepilin-type N-terminal cleavage/methylation domain-containing protein
MKLQTQTPEKGFSLLETLIVVLIALIVLGMAVIGIQTSLGNYKADAAADVVSSQLRAARETAIVRRRWVQVTFNTVSVPPQITYTVIPLNGEIAPPAATLPLSTGSQFYVFPGLPDTPMGFGNTSPIYIGGVSGGPPFMYFSTTGAFVSNPNPFATINGTIFVGTPNQVNTARAVTILGATGRVRTYYWSGAASGWRE